MTDDAEIRAALADKLREAGVQVTEWKPHHELASDLRPGDFVVVFVEPINTSGWTRSEDGPVTCWSRIWDGHEMPLHQPFARIRPVLDEATDNP